jgi:hypothetical protein
MATLTNVLANQAKRTKREAQQDAHIVEIKRRLDSLEAQTSK